MQGTPQTSGTAQDRTPDDWKAPLLRLAAELPEYIAEAWARALRPSVRLSHEDGPPVARLGGNPALPAGVPWPASPGHGPLTLIASVDLAALPRALVDPLVPETGTLLFFAFDGEVDDDGMSETGWPSPWPARVIHVPETSDAEERRPPAGTRSYPPVPLSAVPEGTCPGRACHELVCELEAHPDWDGEEDIRDLIEFLGTDARGGHRFGGYPDSVQGPVFHEVGGEGEESEWLLLAQIDTDHRAGMQWGDYGTLYWLIRRTDLAARRFDQASFTWQCL